MTPPSVLIAGAGPSGLVLAISLRQNGVPVRIIDKEPGPHVGNRGAGIMPRTLELYATLGILDDILSNARALVPMAMYDHGQLVPKSTLLLVEHHEPTPDVPHPNTLALNQDRHEEILRAYLEKLACTVEFGTELRSFEQSGESVVARTLKTAADGTESEETTEDGAHSSVRRQLGLSFLGETRTDKLQALGDIEVEEGLGSDFWHMWNAGAKMILLMQTRNASSKVFTFIYSNRSDKLEDVPSTRDAFVEEFYEVSGRRDVKFGKAAWLSKYRANIRMVDKLRDGRVFVAGDAAHCHTPSGGQGPELLRPRLRPISAGSSRSCHKGLAPTSLLDTYNEERLRVIAFMLDLTTARHDEVAADLKKQGFKMQHPDRMRMLGVNYRGSSIVCEEPGVGVELDAYAGAAGGKIQAAYRAPDAPELVAAGPGTPSAATRLFDVFRGTTHTALVFGGDVERATASDAQKFDAVLEDRAGHAYRVYGVDAEALTVVVVRPDGFVGVVASNAEGIQRYFQKILIAA
ncbi:FAD binding domain-containing protein [Mycena filopes]|nr:FAD binding domain-containing protein [Mycena filopes]